MAKDVVIRSKLEGAGKTKRGLKGIDSGLKNLAKSAMAAGAAYFTARGLISGFKAVIEASGQQELAEKKLSTALGRTSTTLLKYASSLQKVTAFGDEATIEAMSMMAAFTKDEEALKKLTAVTLDYAAATGTDLNAASQLVGRTFGTSMNAMSRYGVAVEGAAGSTERLESLTGNLAKMFGGQAKAQSETMTGNIEQMKNSVGDTAEVIGNLLAPAVISIATGFKGAAESVSEYITQLKLSNATLEGVVDTEEREAIILAKIEKFKDRIIRLDKMGSLDKRTEAQLTEKIAELESDLALNRMGNFAVFSPEEQAHLDRLQATIDKEKAHAEEWSKLAEIQSEEPEILGDIMATESEIAFQREENAAAQEVIQNKLKEMKLEEMALVAKGASTMQSGIESVIRGYVMEAVAGHIAKVLGGVPFPFNLILAAAAGGVVNELMSSAFSQVKAPVSFAQGGDFVTSGPQMIMVGDNPSGKERVQITPSEQSQSFNQGGITLNISAPLVDETVVDSIIPAIEKAQRLNLA